MKPDFEDYVASRTGALLRFAYLLCGDRHLAEDLVQEVLIKAHRRWSAIDAENPDGYLKRALVRTHVSWLRRRASSEITVDALPEGPAGRHFDESQASRDESWAMLATLPRAQRAVLVLRYYEDLDDRRIADVLGVAPSTVRVHAHRGLATLRQTLAQHADEAPTGAGMLDSVRDGAASAARRRRAITAGGIVALLAVLALLVPVLRPKQAPPPVEPSPSVTPTPSVTTASAVALVRMPLTPPEFPYVLGYRPADVGPAFVSVTDGHPVVTFEDGGVEGWPPVQVVVQDVQGFCCPDESEDVTRTTVTVQQSPATAWVGQDWAQLEWRRDGRWLYAFGDGPVDLDELIRIAEGMTPGVTRTDAAGGPVEEITSILAPPGYAVSEWHADRVCATPAGDRSPQLCVRLLMGFSGRSDTGNLIEGGVPNTLVDTLTVDGRPAYVYDIASDLTLVVQRPDGRVVAVAWMSWSGSGNPPYRALTIDELVTVYRGIVFAS